jgi:hypothetical protein
MKSESCARVTTVIPEVVSVVFRWVVFGALRAIALVCTGLPPIESHLPVNHVRHLATPVVRKNSIQPFSTQCNVATC